MPRPTSRSSRATCRTTPSSTRSSPACAAASRLAKPPPRPGRRCAMTAPLRTGDPITVNVALGERAYDIAIGRGLLATLGERVAALRPGAKVAIVTDETVARHHLAAAEAALKAAGIAVTPVRRAGRREQQELRHARARLRRADRRQDRARRSGDRARRRRGRRSRGLRRRRWCAAASTTCRCRRRCWRRSIPRSAARPRSTPATART